MDKVLSIVTGIATAGLVLLAVWFLSGGVPADSELGPLAAFDPRPKSLVVGLTAFGGRFGFWGGLALTAGIGLAAYVAQELLNYGFGLIAVRSMVRQGQPPETVEARIDRFGISNGLKRRLKAAASKARN